jgi:hypothetical protein
MSAFDVDLHLICRFCSSLYIPAIVYVLVGGLRGRDTFGQNLPPRLRGITIPSALSAFGLMGANLCLAKPWPYLTQLLIVLVVSMILFFDFVIQTLIDRGEQE